MGDGMGREEFEQLIRERPVIIRTTDGREYCITSGQNVMIGDFTVGFLVDRDGVKRNAIVGYESIASVSHGATPHP
jgi:hypothetical protein